ncbi:MAG: hypothetical protein ACE5LU_03410 [Anaerolineae bacterium]
MATLTIELPETLTEEIRQHNIYAEEVRSFVVQVIEIWLHSEVAALPETRGAEDEGSRLRFGKSAVPFIERLIGENRRLFERLAEL